MSRTLKEQLADIRAVNNPVYDRISEIVWEYVREQTIGTLSDEFTFRRDIAKLVRQVDRFANPDDDDEDDEEVNLGEFLPALADDSVLLTANGGAH